MGISNGRNGNRPVELKGIGGKVYLKIISIVFCSRNNLISGLAAVTPVWTTQIPILPGRTGCCHTPDFRASPLIVSFIPPAIR